MRTCRVAALEAAKITIVPGRCHERQSRKRPAAVYSVRSATAAPGNIRPASCRPSATYVPLLPGSSGLKRENTSARWGTISEALEDWPKAFRLSMIILVADLPPTLVGLGTWLFLSRGH